MESYFNDLKKRINSCDLDNIGDLIDNIKTGLRDEFEVNRSESALIPAMQMTMPFWIAIPAEIQALLMKTKDPKEQMKIIQNYFKFYQ